MKRATPSLAAYFAESYRAWIIFLPCAVMILIEMILDCFRAALTWADRVNSRTFDRLISWALGE